MEHRVSKTVAFFMACLMLPSSVFAWPGFLPKKLIRLSYTSGYVPLTVSIIGPLDLVSTANGYPNNSYWCGYRVSWGDGTVKNFYNDYKHGLPPTACAQGLEHVYGRAGTFTVKLVKFHTGSWNKPINDWVGTARVIVNRQETPSS